MRYPKLMTAIDEKGDKAMMVHLQQWLEAGQKMYKEQLALTLPILEEALQLSNATTEEVLAEVQGYHSSMCGSLGPLY